VLQQNPDQPADRPCAVFSAGVAAPAQRLFAEKEGLVHLVKVPEQCTEDLRRTQLLSAIAASIVLGGLIYLIASWTPRKTLRAVAAFSLVMPIIWFGACRIIERQASHRNADQYRPETRILPRPAAPEAVRRYGPL
jgi:hypothetical protein